MNDQASTYCERYQNERLFHTITAPVFDAALKLDSSELADGVVKYIAISALRVVELYSVPAEALERFSARMCAVPGAAP